jgi:hypothetical protein
VQRSFWRLPTIDPPPPLHPASVSSPRTKGGELHTRRAVRGGGSIFRKTPDILLASYSIIPLRPQLFLAVSKRMRLAAVLLQGRKIFCPNCSASRSPNFLVGEPKLHRSKVLKEYCTYCCYFSEVPLLFSKGVSYIFARVSYKESPNLFAEEPFCKSPQLFCTTNLKGLCRNVQFDLQTSPLHSLYPTVCWRKTRQFYRKARFVSQTYSFSTPCINVLQDL